MLSHPTEPESPEDLAPPDPSLLDLSRQLRNLLLLRPLFQLELNKTRIGEDGASDDGLFQGVDTFYLALSALDFMMEATTVSTGAPLGEVLEHLAHAARRMKSTLSKPQSFRVAEVLLNMLDNKSGGYKEFAFDHFDAVKGTSRTVRFRLVRYEPDIEDVYRYRPTAEGYLVYLGMLDLAPEDSQELMEKMLDLLVQRGKFDTALDIAKRARTLSIEYRQRIRDRLHQAHRAPGSVNWTKDLGPYLQDARGHVAKRQHEDQRMEEAVKDALGEAVEPRNRASLAKLLRELQDASILRGRLVGEITGAGDAFLESQRSLFRARRPTGLPDLEIQLFPRLLDLTGQRLSDNADQLFSALYPAAWPKVYDINTVISLLLESRPEDGPVSQDPGELVPLAVIPDEFPEELTRKASAWLAHKFADNTTHRIDELLMLAEDEGLSRTLRRCLVLMLYRSFSAEESEFPHLTSKPAGRFDNDVVTGINLQFIPRGASE